jgi:hypothetical protein
MPKISLKYSKSYYWLTIKQWAKHPSASLRYWIRQKLLSQELGREANFGDMFADSLGTRVNDPMFQHAMAESLAEIGEDWP